ncbi:hypothetical protein ACIGQE_01905 [Streptomyces sp. NPDC053429]|uniref:hypothetical protein n=1 Tax=Streptomyces sp. NPDC053429 TaxID=3365702 RepID=UPI0037CEEFE4
MTWQHLKDLKPSEYEEAADGWGDVSGRAYAAKERVENEMLAKLRDTQQAQTADAALGDLTRLAGNFQYIHAECGLIRTALNGFAAEVATPQNQLKAALEDAEHLGFTVHQDGSVSYPAATPSTPYNGMVSKETGDGRAYITVTSPCYTKPTSSPSTSPQAMLPSSGELSSDEASQQHVLAHSSRIYDALRVEADASAGAPLQTVENDGATYVHHAWATEPLAGERAVRAMARGRAFLEDSGWRVRAGSGRLVAMHPTDQTVAQIATSPSGSLRVGVTGPAVPLLRADA